MKLPSIAIIGEYSADFAPSAGISAGIDMSLHIVRRFLGQTRALKVATYMEYKWSE
ncbi:hypothetical protein SH139x_002737 [Planctomycetaceae bacterium SH139]